MGKYKAYLEQPKKDEFIFKKTKLESFDNDLKNQLKWIETLGNKFANCLEYLETWEVVPKKVSNNNIGFKQLNDARSLADRYISILTHIDSFENTAQINNQQQDSKNVVGSLENNINQLKQSHESLREIYKNKERLDNAQKLIETLDSINKWGQNVDGKVKELHEEIIMIAEESKKTFDDTLKEAALYKEKCKEEYEKSEEYTKEIAMSKFGKAFQDEAEEAQSKAFWAGAFSIISILAILAVVFFAVIGELFGWYDIGLAKILRENSNENGQAAVISKSMTFPIICWISSRVVIIGVLLGLVYHFFRERKNYLHVAISNRHRRNLCNAYISVAAKMEPKDREKYLEEILPQLAILGKTGFIGKENTEDISLLLKNIKDVKDLIK